MIGCDHDKVEITNPNSNANGKHSETRDKLGAPRTMMYGVPGLSGDNDELSE